MARKPIGSTANAPCRHCRAARKNHLEDPDKAPRCPGGAGTRFEHFDRSAPQPFSFDADEIAVLKIVLSEAHRYGTLRASNPVLKRLQAQFDKLADKRAVGAMKRESHRV